MTKALHRLDDLVEAILDVPPRGIRRVVALCGPPASGKSTLSETLCGQLRSRGRICEVVPMDGFHLSNQILVDMGLLERKGAPETFDVDAFVRLVSQFHDTPELSFPTFDRARDVTVPDSGTLAQACDTVIVEGNYLLFDAPQWRDLEQYWDISISLNVSPETLRDRLVARWLKHGLSQEKAEMRAEGNDLKNARTIARASISPDILFQQT